MYDFLLPKSLLPLPIERQYVPSSTPNPDVLNFPKEQILSVIYGIIKATGHSLFFFKVDVIQNTKKFKLRNLKNKAIKIRKRRIRSTKTMPLLKLKQTVSLSKLENEAPERKRS